jgi:hypothetical protein
VLPLQRVRMDGWPVTPTRWAKNMAYQLLEQFIAAGQPYVDCEHGDPVDCKPCNARAKALDRLAQRMFDQSSDQARGQR